MQQAAGSRTFRDRLRRDPNLFLELEFCATGPIPHSAFLSWRPDDRAQALAHFIEKSLRCTMCGTAQWEWDRDRYAYEPVLHHCLGCAMREEAQKDLESKAGQTVTLARTRGADAVKRRETLRILAARDREDELDDADDRA